jgi:hypothetical protein
MIKSILTLLFLAAVALGSTYASDNGSEIPDFNLNKDLVKLVVRPTCGSDPSRTSANPANGWSFSHMACGGSNCSDVYSRTCEEVITIYWPWGAESYVHVTTEYKSLDLPD